MESHSDWTIQSSYVYVQVREFVQHGGDHCRGYDQRDSGALDFSEQTLRDAPRLFQQLWYPLPLSVQRTYQTNCRHMEQRCFFIYLFLYFILASAFC